MRKKRFIYVLGVMCLVCLAACAKTPAEQPGVTQAPESGTDGNGNSSEEKTVGVTTKTPTKEVTAPAYFDVTEVVKGEAWELGNFQGNLLNDGWVCESEGKLYYRDYNHNNFLCRMNADGTGKQVLAEEIPAEIQVVGDWVYFVDDDEGGKEYGRIKRVDKEGGKVTLVGEDKVGYYLVTGEGIFYNSEDIKRMNLDGSECTVIQEYTGKGEYAWLSIFGDCLFTADVLSGKQLHAVKLDGSGQYLLTEGILYPTVEGDNLWFSGKKGEVTKLSLKTGEEKKWNETYAFRIIPYKDVIYYHNLGGVYALKEEDNEPEKLYPSDPDGEHFIELFWVAADKVFFCDYLEEGNKTFQYLDLITGELGIVP